MLFRRRRAATGSTRPAGRASTSLPPPATRPETPLFPHPWWREMLGAGTWREIAIGAIVGLVVIGFVAERWGWGPARDMTIAMVATLGSMWWQHRRRKARDAAPGGPPMPRRR